VGGASGGRFVESGGVKSKTKRDLDTGAEGLCVAEGNDTRVVDLGLDERGLVKVSFGTKFKGNTAMCAFVVVNSFSTSLNISTDTVVVAGGEGVQAVETVEGDGVVGLVVTKGDSEFGEAAIGDVVTGFSSQKHTVTSDNGVGGEHGALEDVKGSAGVDARLLVDSVKESSLVALVRVKAGVQVKLDTLGNLVVNFNLTAKDVAGGPSLGDGEPMLEVNVFCLNVSINEVGLGVTESSSLEGDTVGSLGLDLKGGTVEVVVLAEEVVGGLAKVLP